MKASINPHSQKSYKSYRDYLQNMLHVVMHNPLAYLYTQKGLLVKTVTWHAATDSRLPCGRSLVWAPVPVACIFSPPSLPSSIFNTFPTTLNVLGLSEMDVMSGLPSIGKPIVIPFNQKNL